MFSDEDWSLPALCCDLAHSHQHGLHLCHCGDIPWCSVCPIVWSSCCLGCLGHLGILKVHIPTPITLLALQCILMLPLASSAYICRINHIQTILMHLHYHPSRSVRLGFHMVCIAWHLVLAVLSLVLAPLMVNLCLFDFRWCFPMLLIHTVLASCMGSMTRADSSEYAALCCAGCLLTSSDMFCRQLDVLEVPWFDLALQTHPFWLPGWLAGLGTCTSTSCFGHTLTLSVVDFGTFEACCHRLMVLVMHVVWRWNMSSNRLPEIANDNKEEMSSIARSHPICNWRVLNRTWAGVELEEGIEDKSNKDEMWRGD